MSKKMKQKIKNQWLQNWNTNFEKIQYYITPNQLVEFHWKKIFFLRFQMTFCPRFGLSLSAQNNVISNLMIIYIFFPICLCFLDGRCNLIALRKASCFSFFK